MVGTIYASMSVAFFLVKTNAKKKEIYANRNEIDSIIENIKTFNPANHTNPKKKLESLSQQLEHSLLAANDLYGRKIHRNLRNSKNLVVINVLKNLIVRGALTPYTNRALQQLINETLLVNHDEYHRTFRQRDMAAFKRRLWSYWTLALSIGGIIGIGYSVEAFGTSAYNSAKNFILEYRASHCYLDSIEVSEGQMPYPIGVRKNCNKN